MQQEYLLKQLYYKIKKIRVSSPDKEALRRFDAVVRFEAAIFKGLSSSDAAQAVGIPRSTLYKWRKKKTAKLETLSSKSRRPKIMRKGKDKSALGIRIEALRCEYPKWGKRKITKILLHEGVKSSESAVGRIISGLIKRGVIKNAKFYNRPNYSYKPKPQRPYAIRLKRGQKLTANFPGEAVQVDHMTVKMHGGVVKHFNAVCTVSRWNVADAYTNASAKTASLFIDKLIKESPFQVQRIQVDGGSEFMCDFEQACKKHNIELSVLAPKSPKLNGHVERINGTWRSDFYDVYDLPTQVTELRPLLNDYMDTYNWDRPHEALDLQTPQEFLEHLGYKISPLLSHM